MVNLFLKLNVLSLQLPRLIIQLINLAVFLFYERTNLNESLFVLLKHLLSILEIAVGLSSYGFSHSKIIFELQVLLYFFLDDVLQGA
jgi:hypothetical protein